jgi:hypothetical protein
MTMRVYSRNFSTAYHEMLAGQVEHRMRQSIKMVGDFWFTAWVDAGQPDLLELAGISLSEEALGQEAQDQEQWSKGSLKVRGHDNN